MRIRTLQALALLLGVVLLVSACSRTETNGTEADVEFFSILDADDGSGTFTASGGAVESGEMCPEGTYEAVASDFEGDPWWFEDLWTCTDGSGSFTLRAEGDSPEEGAAELKSVEGTWTIVGAGTGDYADLGGSGAFESSLDSDWNETFTGDLTQP